MVVEKKAAYEAPILTVHGTVETLTQNGNGHFDRGGTNGNGYGYGHCKGNGNGHDEDPLGSCFSS